ncbi:ribonuclease H-like domain-containing protein [Mycena belliarum]|uniref:Ribonuclease H-like domain-containing protein n=1 Tax=Mycena belliarum TaxID=1033014 RepID=A0AAD6UGF7_9AGAR|nr:ribonuclease H-like domain-containing protein [Mycena belliae]
MQPLWHLCALFLTTVLSFMFGFWLRRPGIVDARSSLVEDPGAGKTTSTTSKVKQPYDAFLLVDVEATCNAGTDFSYPNEIIEFPVCLMRWTDRDGDKASRLEVIEEFRSFIKPSWRPQLSQFCTELTGITQEQVDGAPAFPAMLRSLRSFLVKHKLIEKSGKRRLRFCWCSDGPWDLRDFVVKECFISQVPMPDWMQGDILDVRALVMAHTSARLASKPLRGPKGTLNIPAQLSILGLPPFLGRQHSGIDDTRNLARIIAQLAVDGVRLQPNTPINPRRRWFWMGKAGRILEEDLAL